MNNELEEAKRRLEILLKDDCDCPECVKNKEAYKTVLEALKNSIPKKKIEDKIEELKSQCGGNVFHIQQTLNAEIRLLQEFLEDK